MFEASNSQLKLLLYTTTAIVIFFIFLFSASTASAATIYVNSSTGNDTTGDGTSGTPYATFHKAYTIASSTVSDTIDLTGTFDWTNAGETGDVAESGYTISKNMTIQGQSADSTFVQASSTENTADRSVFAIASGKTVTIRNLTVRYGVASSASNAGGIHSLGNLNLEYATVSYNRYNSTSSYGAGGILMPENGALTLNISTSTISYNGFDGKYYGAGGIYVGQEKTINITASTISNNTATSTNPTSFPYSYAQPAGGLRVYRFSNIDINNSTFSNNTTNSYAGAINIYYSISYITNTTIANNSAGSGGGGLIFDASSDSYKLYLKNNIIANNTGVSGAADDFRVDSGATGSMADNGYNIIEVSTNYTWSGTGNITGDQANLNLSSSLADNSATNGVETLALSSGSVAIDAGTTTANGSVSVLVYDQRGGLRSGTTTDIGAYEYNADLTDITSPTATLTAPANGATVSGSSVPLTATASDNAAVAGVSFYIDGVLEGSEDTSSPYAITWDSTGVSSGSYTIYSVTRDTSSNYATSTSISVTVDNVSATTSSVTATSTTATTTVITWTTSEVTSSLVNLGVASSYGSSTPETDTATRVTSHSVTISSLIACTSYHFQVQSIDAGLNTATSTDYTFETLGCTGDTTISTSTKNDIATSTGGSITNGDLTVTVPIEFTATSSSVIFQINQLERDSFLTAASTPSGVIAAGSDIFQVSAFTDPSTRLDTFTESITLTLSYSTSDFDGITESTMKIYRYSSSIWNVLSSCSVDTDAKTVTCTTTAFSDFAIFGEVEVIASVVVEQSGGGGMIFTGHASDFFGYVAPREQIVYPDGRIVYLDKVSVPETNIETTETIVETTKITEASDTNVFNRNLYRGLSGEDVLELQKFLNQNGFVLAQDGYGSIGNETIFFGKLTKDAVSRYQIAQNIFPTYGYFGPLTRASLESFK